MRKRISNVISDLEKQHDIKILLAVESGSRAWGFPSKDSDYDVRFFYLHKPQWYLSVLPQRDVIEIMLDNDILDLSGWDLRKTLVLYRKFNPPLMEWLGSDMIYHEFSDVPQTLRDLKKTYFSPISSINHYLHMADGNFRDYLQNATVKLKKYFYVLRPLLACMWIEKYNGYPPVEFDKLLDFCSKANPEIIDDVKILLEKKISGDELDQGQKIESINNFIETKLTHFREYAKSADITKPMAEENLNRIFMNALGEVYGRIF